MNEGTLPASAHPPEDGAIMAETPMLDRQSPESAALSEAAQSFVYLADAPDPDAAGEDPLLFAASALLVNEHAQTPIAIGLLGGPGSGKTSALAFVVETARRKAEEAGLSLATVHVNAAGDTADEPESHIAAQVYDALAAPSDSGRVASIAREAVASIRDVHAVAREAADRLAEMRDNLETERSSLGSVAGRRARLAETVLFETPGSRVDAFARAHRAKIEARLRAFGFEGDLVAVWKELVREMAERNPLGKLGACIQTLWAYRGQGRLLSFAAVLAIIAWGLSAAQGSRASWTGWMKANGGSQIAGLGSWIDAHASLIGTLEGLAILVAALCLVADVVRAARFLNPVFSGAAFLRIDLDARRRDLDALLAHQTRRVDLATREVDAQARRAEEAERRAEGPRAATSRSEELRAFYGDDDKSSHARARFASDFLESLERILTREGAAAPRILVALDGFESLSPKRSGAYLEAARRLLSRRGFALAFALDDAQIARDLGSDATALLTRLFQIPLRLAGRGSEMGQGAAEYPSFAAGASGYDAALSEKETAMIRSLAPFAGPRPRDAKRFANLYRFARAALSSADESLFGALAVEILAAMGAFGPSPVEDLGGPKRMGARDAAAASGFPATEEAARGIRPLTMRLSWSSDSAGESRGA